MYPLDLELEFIPLVLASHLKSKHELSQEQMASVIRGHCSKNNQLSSEKTILISTSSDVEFKN